MIPASCVQASPLFYLTRRSALCVPQVSEPPMVCLTSEQMGIPGLLLIPSFVTEEEEQVCPHDGKSPSQRVGGGRNPLTDEHFTSVGGDGDEPFVDTGASGRC